MKIAELFVEIGAKIDKFEKGMSDVQKGMVKTGQKFDKIGKSLTRNVTLPLVAVGVASIKAFADFDKAMTESLAIMGNVSDSMKKKMSDVAKTISEETTFSAKELAEAYFFLASAGMDAEQSVSALGDVAKFAQAGAFDLATATDLLTDAQTALGMSSKDAAENQKNLVALSDVLVKANTLANASVQQFSEALTNRTAPALVQVNKNMEEGVAVLAAFADKGIKGREAGTRFSMMLTNLETAARKNADEFKKFNVSVYDSQGNMRNLADIIGDMEKALGGLPPKQRSAAMAQMGFNDRARQSIVALLGSSEKIRQWEKDLKNAGGTTDKVAKNQMKAFANQMKLVWNSIVNLAASIGEQLAPALLNIVKAMKPLLKFAAGVVEKFSKLPGPVKTVAMAFVGILAALGPALIIFGKILTVLPSIMLAVKFLAAKFLILKGVLLALTGPIGLVVLAVAALAAGAYLIIKNWKKIKTFFIGIWSGIVAAIGPIVGKIFDIVTYPYKKIIEFIKKIGPEIIEVITYPFKTAWKFVKDTFIKVAKWIIDKFLWLGEQIAKIPLVKKFVKGFKEGMEEARRSIENTEVVITERGMKMAEAFVKSAKKTDIWTKANKLLGGALDNLGTKINETERKTGDLGTTFSVKLNPALIDASGKIKLLAGQAEDLWKQFDNLELATEDAGEAYLYMEDVATASLDSILESVGVTTTEQQKAFDKTAVAAEQAAIAAQEAWEYTYRHVLQFARDFSSGLADIFTDTLKITESITHQMTEFDDAYYQGALQNAKDAYEKKKQWIMDNIADEEAKQQALADLEAAHKNSMDKIRNDEDAARQKHADDELRRQESLWNKVKMVFGDAVENMIQTWMTEFIDKILLSFVKDLLPSVKEAGESITSNLGNAVSDAGKVAVNLAEGIASAIVALAKGIVAAAKIIASGAGALLKAAAVLLAVYAAFKIINKLLGGTPGAGAAEYTNKILLTIREHIGMQSEKMDETNRLLAGFYGKFDSMLAELYKIRDATQGILSALTSQGTVYVDVFRSAVFEGIGVGITDSIGQMSGDLGGAISDMGGNIGNAVSDVAGKIDELDLSVHVDAPDLSGIADALGDIRGKIGEGIPEFQTGGFVPRDTIAKLHAGERVIPKGGDGGTTVVLNISAMDAIGVRDFMRKRGIPEIIAGIKKGGNTKTQMKEALNLS